MPGFQTFGQLVENQSNVEHYSGWRKVPTQVTTFGIWFDLSMSPGNPAPQHYAASPMVATRLARSTDGGINHGASSTPAYKYLRRFMGLSNFATPLPMPCILCDYLMYYPFVDEGSTDEQLMDNSTTLSRYTDGLGVQIMPVVVGAHSLAAGVTFTCSYTNQNGTSGRTTAPAALTAAQSVNGTIATSSRALATARQPFLALQGTDSGVRSIQSCTFSVADVGLIALVLVKPLAQFIVRGVDAPVEKDYLLDHSQLPRIYDDAYLNMICCPSGSLANVLLMGDIITTWK